MIQKYVYGKPFSTEAVVTEVPAGEGTPAYGKVDTEKGFCFTYIMEETDIVYGLGEANRGLNKRGYCYISDCTDDPNHTEDKRSLYGAHNFIVVSGRETFGLFFDYPSAMTFDIGYTRMDTLQVSCADADLNLFVIEGDSPYDIVKQFRKIIGRSYIPPKYAFGFGQSRWGYKTKEDFRKVADGYRENKIPLDMVYMDIDYMQDFKDFTLHEENFPDFAEFVREMKDRNLRLIPIIDAGVKVEDGYDVYEEGVKNRYFCQRGDGSDFVAAVWPGNTHFPDVLNAEARAWFGDKYRVLTDQGIEGFWNDMNEPAIFYSPEGIDELKGMLKQFLENENYNSGINAGTLAVAPTSDTNDSAETENAGASIWPLMGKINALANSKEDYRRFYHTVNGERIRHDKVHNLFGYNMTRAAGEAFERIDPEKRFLMFSRSSYIGMHRYGGIWMGDNKSWWSHILLNLKMLPSLNMCGFLYTGADLGGFGADATRDLLLRWLALGVFTPLMRDHAAAGTRDQECYQFENLDDFRHVVGVRYRLIPYLYSEYMKAALNDDLYFKPLAFAYPEDSMAVQVEDQMMLGNEVMIAPVYTQNARGRYVYLPEEMKFVKFLPDGSVSEETLPKGHHYVEIALNEVPLFIRSGKCIPLAESAEYVEALDTKHLTMLGYPGAEYTLYEDDGIGKDYENKENYRTLKCC
ncbi:alpha-glucosidase [Schaedlerella arabinosiphila]|uniref:Alpha-glucosidase n=1 Tax=Schaedlerella arabinosiphila TaxID=2044587 RepID=A0A9X5CEM5_9FIRM|nr:TIM-barrel domain-containing protein [Schaedlerella arabinosiphila]KAI4440935.1 Alpha-xylosidase BoGH31A [Schaedlerella arabinosiphila]NDO72108.1 alpha-glucosidase [Schaedlerella arabinosiphila]